MTSRLATAINVVPKTITEIRNAFTPLPDIRSGSVLSRYSPPDDFHERNYLTSPNGDYRHHDLGAAAMPQDMDELANISNQ